MKAVELAVAQEDGWRKIAITLIMALRGALECNGLFSTISLKVHNLGVSRKS
jgi:hypothetical protein